MRRFLLLCYAISMILMSAVPSFAASRALLLQPDSAASSDTDAIEAALKTLGFDTALHWPQKPDFAAPDDLTLVFWRGPLQTNSNGDVKRAEDAVPSLNDLAARLRNVRGAVLVLLEVWPQRPSETLSSSVRHRWHTTFDLKNTAGRATIWACDKGQRPQRRANSASCFALAVARGLEGAAADERGVLSARSLSQYVQRATFTAALRESGEVQTPTFSLSGRNFVLANGRALGAGGATAVEAMPALSPAQRFAVSFGRGCELWLDGRFEAARRRFGEALSIDPQSSRAALMAGLSSAVLGHNEEARQSFESAARLDEKWWRPRFEIAQLAGARGDVAAALQLLEAAQKLAPNRAQPILAAARWWHLARHDPVRAEIEYRRALAFDPSSAVAVSGIGNTQFDRSQFARAADSFYFATTLDPDDGAHHAALGWTLLHLKRRDEALRQAQIAQRLGFTSPHPLWAKLGLTPPVANAPDVPKTLPASAAVSLVGQGEAYLATQKFRPAQFAFEDAVEAVGAASVSKTEGASVNGSKSLEARALAGWGRAVWLGDRDSSGARSLVERALKLNPSQPSAVADLVSLRLSSGEAVGDLEQTLVALSQSEVGNAEVPALLGEIAFRRFDYAAATKYFETALSRHADESRAVYGLGEIAAQDGRNDEALKYFERAAAIEPGNAQFWNRLGIAHSPTRVAPGDMAQAEAEFRRAIKVAPDWPVPLTNLAVLLMNARRDFAGAQTLLRRAVALAPADGLPHVQLAFCLLALSRRDEAVMEANRALALGFSQAHPVFDQLGIIPRPR